MLGKRFRRTTSMSHLGPAAVAPERKQVSLPDAHKITEPLTADHNQNHIWPQPPPQPHTIIVEHEESETFAASSGYGELRLPNHAGLLPWGHTNSTCTESPTSILQTHQLSPVSPLVAYDQMGVLWPRATTAGAAFVAPHSAAGKQAERQQVLSPVDFLQVCYCCKKRLGLESDIFMYRGDTAFCSEKCRHWQIMRDERKSSRKKGTSATVVAA